MSDPELNPPEQGSEGDQPQNDQPQNDQPQNDQPQNDQPQNDQPQNDQTQNVPANRKVQAADERDNNQIAQFVTTIRNAEQQVGAHIINALQHNDTVAVITTVAMGPDGLQRVISAALNPERMQQVEEILKAAEEEREEEEPCVGFHCLVKPKKK